MMEDLFAAEIDDLDDVLTMLELIAHGDLNRDEMAAVAHGAASLAANIHDDLREKVSAAFVPLHKKH